jgi:microcystin degradation protein MlrC
VIPRIALLGFSIECNRFAPVATEADFATRTLFRGAALLEEARAAAPELDGIAVVVVSQRVQCADPAFFEAFGLDIGRARVVQVKSRGHFRGGFDEFFRHEQVVEVDAPGLTSPILGHFAWKHLARPVIPIDAQAQWSPA